MAGETSASVPSHLFVELTSLSELSFPTIASSRIKYTCVSASPRIVAVGSSSGTVYLFSRYAAKTRKSLCNVPVQVIPCQEGAITLVEVSPDEKAVAVATNRGFLCVLDISKSHSATILNSVLHIGAEITCFRFSLNGSRLYAGDNLGRVSCSKLSSKLVLRSPCEIVLRLDSRIVQIDHFNSSLLVSTLSRCYLHNAARQTTNQIGTKLRNGNYGACFYPKNTDLVVSDGPSIGNNAAGFSPLIFCARPGGRLWEVDEFGKVYSTHQFSGTRDVWSIPGLRDFSITSLDKLSTVTFGTVHVISEFILTANGSSLVLVDPKRGKLVSVADISEAISQFCVCDNDVFLLTSDGYIRKVTLFPLEKAVEKLQYRERYIAAAQLVCAIRDMDSTYSFRPDLVRDIRGRLDNTDELSSLIRRLDSVVLQDSNKGHDEKDYAKYPQVAKLASGIHRVVKGMENSGYEDDFTFRIPVNGRYRNSYENILSQSPNMRSKSTPSMDKMVAAAVGASGNDIFVDVENADSDTAMVGHASRITTECCMNTSRSEESLIPLLRSSPQLFNDHLPRLHSDWVNCGNCGETRNEAQATSLNVTNGLSPNGEENRLFEYDQNSAEKSMIAGSATSPEGFLKETLKTSGKLLMDAVSKMSFLDMGPDFNHPSYLVIDPDGYYGNDNEKESDGSGKNVIEGDGNGVEVVDGHENGNTISRDEYAKLNGDIERPVDRFPVNQPPVVQRVLRSTSKNRMRQRKTKKLGGNGGLEKVDISTRKVNGNRDGSGAADDTGKIIDVAEVKQKALKIPRCGSCGLHNTWRFLLTVGPNIEKLNLRKDFYKDGGVPGDVNSWRDLIMEWKQRRSYPSSSSGFCSSCGHLWRTWFERSMEVKLDSAVGTEEERHVEEIIAAISDLPESSIAGIFHSFGASTSAVDPANAVESTNAVDHGAATSGMVTSGTVAPGTMASGAMTSVPVQIDPTLSMDIIKQGDEAVMAISMYYNPVYESVYNKDDDSQLWRWLGSVGLDTLIAVGSKLVDMEALADILVTVAPEYCNDLSGEFYRSVCTSSQSCLVSMRVLECIASDIFNLSDVFMVEENESCSEAVTKDYNRLICSFCSLPLAMKVNDNNERVLMFDCDKMLDEELTSFVDSQLQQVPAVNELLEKLNEENERIKSQGKCKNEAGSKASTTRIENLILYRCLQSLSTGDAGEDCQLPENSRALISQMLTTSEWNFLKRRFPDSALHDKDISDKYERPVQFDSLVAKCVSEKLERMVTMLVTLSGESGKAGLERRIEQISVNREQVASLEQSRCKLVLVYLMALSSHVQTISDYCDQFRFTEDFSCYEATTDLLLAKAEALLLKARLLELQMHCAVYTKEEVEKLNRLRSDQIRIRAQLEGDVEEMNGQIEGYNNIAGPDFIQLVQEYGKVRDAIEQHIWALQEISLDDESLSIG